MTNYLYINFTDPIPEITTLKLCFNNANTTSIVRFDNASISQVNYPETVTYEIERDLETINAILISIVFQDFFQEKYWVGGSLLGRIVLQIDGVEINSDQISQVENNPERIQLQVLLVDSIS